MGGRTGKRLTDIGEDGLIRMLTSGLVAGGRVLHGPGDDCAVLASADPGRVCLFKTDCVVEGVHYTPDTAPSLVGRKAIARGVSDIAAMAGRPESAVVTLVFPADRSTAYVRHLYAGLRRAATLWGIDIVGGETSSLPAGASGAVVSVALLGSAAEGRYILRSGARPGDVVMVTGRLGGSIRGHHLKFEPRLEEAAWLAEHFPPTAMMDLSDGLAKDLPRMAEAGGVGFKIDPEAIPRKRGCSLEQALGDGEDYELLFTCPAADAGALSAAWEKSKFSGLQITKIGNITRGKAIHLPFEKSGGWEHFS